MIGSEEELGGRLEVSRVIDTISVEIRGVLIQPLIADKLGVPAGSVGLQLIRYFRDRHNRPVEIAVNTHPAERFAYRIQVVRAKGAAENLGDGGGLA